MADREEKRGRQMLENLKNEKSFLDKIKSIVYSFWRAIIWMKIRVLSKIADTSFNMIET